MVLINGVLEKNLLKKIDNMAYGSLNDEHLNRLRQMMARDDSIKQRIQSQIDRDAIDDYRDSYQAPSPSPNTSYSSKYRDPDLKIQTLTDKNKELTEKYATLLNKENQIVEVYRKQEADIKNIKIRLEKREKHTENVAILKKYLKDVYNNIIAWFNS